MLLYRDTWGRLLAEICVDKLWCVCGCVCGVYGCGCAVCGGVGVGVCVDV